MAYAQFEIHPGELETETPLGFWDWKGSHNLSQTTRLGDSQEKKRTCRIVDFAVQAHHRVKLKQG